MADPLAVLRRPARPIDPDPAFARALRSRLERALARPEGSTMPASPPTVPVPVPVGVVPYLAVEDGRAALTWYADALGAVEQGQRYEMTDGSIGHAQMQVHGAEFYLAEGYAEQNVLPPIVGAPVATSLVLTVPDADDATERAVDAGASLERAPGDNPYGRTAVVRDPYGHRWMLQEPAPAAPPARAEEAPRPGDLAYAALWTPDVERAEAFYAAVLGWEVAPGSVPQGRQVTSTTLSTGLWGGQDVHTLFCCWHVDDVDAAARRVRAAGGTADEARDEPYGRIADCTDPWGLAFAVFAPPLDGDPGVRTPPNGARPGDLSYLTLLVRDQAAAVRFYAGVLGWRVVGDSEPADVRPMLGIAEADSQRAVPCWKVDDVAAALERVRAAGGAAGEPTQRPYGVLAECTDDQGSLFYLSDA